MAYKMDQKHRIQNSSKLANQSMEITKLRKQSKIPIITTQLTFTTKNIKIKISIINFYKCKTNIITKHLKIAKNTKIAINSLTSKKSLINLSYIIYKTAEGIDIVQTALICAKNV